EVMDTCSKKIRERHLAMKLIEAEFSFDRSKIMFYFTAEGRVDFRDLVKDLANAFKTRIELKQIGVRDEAKMLGGLGPCGRALCCATYLKDFDPVTMKMAKEQNLPLNPTKISGLCGRLMCCLGYEYKMYKELMKGLPRVGDTVKTEKGQGKIISINAIKRSATVELEDGSLIEMSYK
ncbi:MAG: stage 0 sporulation protein, partial [Candidatus Omnitrophica bacterium]|nr:stage 0 sporulation protein [Candidatus Omnitrophota bacterium]